MTVKYYSIAGITVKMRLEKDEPPQMFRRFEAEKPSGGAAVNVDIYWHEHLFHQWYGLDYCQSEKDFPHLFISRKTPGVRLQADRAWEHLVIEGAACGMEGVMEVFLAAFYSRLSYHRGILVHASCISWKEEGVIFTAPSGTGKTTQAELWKKYRDAEILNGDKVILECREEEIRAWGSPWKGSSPYAVNRSVPLRAVIVLEQGKENRIRKLTGEETTAKFFPHVFYPSWSEVCVAEVMWSMDVLVRKVPVYFLSCLPDSDAVELVRRTVWGDEEK
ncbi:hypothetical protein [Lachnoclostridium sp. An169]|uniref:hypothetical protein n=1 Tax=Lachnoclostridium sp. An169 TaxID=1965569 RepID=UPI0011230E61|nr:hypothetical protein [Lachnoclostridium sp. An169]